MPDLPLFLLTSSAELLAFFPSSATILLIVWSTNSDAMVVLLLSRIDPITSVLNDDTYLFFCVIHPDVQNKL